MNEHKVDGARHCNEWTHGYYASILKNYTTKRILLKMKHSCHGFVKRHVGTAWHLTFFFYQFNSIEILKLDLIFVYWNLLCRTRSKKKLKEQEDIVWMQIKYGYVLLAWLPHTAYLIGYFVSKYKVWFHLTWTQFSRLQLDQRLFLWKHYICSNKIATIRCYFQL